MSTKKKKVCNDVLEQIIPKDRERAEIEALVKRLEKKVASAAKELGVSTEVRVEGSVAKDTWLGEEPEIDIFMRVSASIPRNALGEICLKIARKATKGYRQIERFAEHPYLEAFIDRVRVNIVPCYAVKRGEWISATDRTPFHTDYMRKHLNSKLRSEVRLLKRFMKGIGVYGAEIRVGGFSGYLCELLILHHRSFINTLKAFAKHKQNTAIDIENYYANRANELKLLFKEPLVLVDPVDQGRNVASAVKPLKLCTLVAGAQAFLKCPSKDFFYPLETIPLSAKALKTKLEKRGSTLMFLAFGKVNVVPDVLWGQLYKSQRSLRKLLQLTDFNVLRDVAWSDEKNLNMFVFELEQGRISPVKKHLGPPLDKERDCQKFLAKHQNGLGTISGPYLEDGRWAVLLQRKYTDVVALFGETLKDGGRRTGVADQVSQVIRKHFGIFVDEDIVSVYRKNGEFAKFLTEFLLGTPKWLKNAHAECY